MVRKARLTGRTLRGPKRWLEARSYQVEDVPKGNPRDAAVNKIKVRRRQRHITSIEIAAAAAQTPDCGEGT